MRQFLIRWSTTLVFWTFVVTAVTGVLLYFRVHTPPTEVLHIWIGLLMVAAFVPHVVRNWKAFVGYFAKPPLYVVLVATVAVSGTFAALEGGRGGGQAGPPGTRGPGAINTALLNAPLSALAPVLRTDAPALMARLDRLGAHADSPGATIGEAATASGKNPVGLLNAVLAERGQGAELAAAPN